MTAATSIMRGEIAEIPHAAARLADASAQQALRAAAAAIAAADPAFVATVARGSSDHAATYLSYCVQIRAGVPVASVYPSVASVYGARMRANGVLALAISQSGASADLAQAMDMLIAGGAVPVVLTNRVDSALAGRGRPAVDIAAGPERAVAATKSFVNSILAGLWILAHWTDDAALAEGLRRMPEALAEAAEAPVADLIPRLGGAVTLTARGPAFGLALEGALKVQEVLGRPAVAYSGAELLHGPISRLGADDAVLAFGLPDDPGMAQCRARLAEQSVTTLSLGGGGPDHPCLAALPDIARLYRADEARAVADGRDPDRPAHLQKETVTL